MKQLKFIIQIYIFVTCLLSDQIIPISGSVINYTQVLFEWEQEPNASYYHFQLSDDIMFTNIINSIYDSTLIIILNENLERENNYYWRVRPYYPDNSYGAWLDTLFFKINKSLFDEISTEIINVNNQAMVIGRAKHHYSIYGKMLRQNKKFAELFDIPPRKEDSKAEQIHYDIGASAQKVLEEIMLRMANHVHKKTGMKNLCLGGGVALNGVANYRILKEGPLKMFTFLHLREMVVVQLDVHSIHIFVMLKIKGEENIMLKEFKIISM